MDIWKAAQKAVSSAWNSEAGQAARTSAAERVALEIGNNKRDAKAVVEQQVKKVAPPNPELSKVKAPVQERDNALPKWLWPAVAGVAVLVGLVALIARLSKRKGK